MSKSTSVERWRKEDSRLVDGFLPTIKGPHYGLDRISNVSDVNTLAQSDAAAARWA
ncbi:hypothetical protein ACIBTZ_04680 [Micromonospora sp. NPDC049460]|uniref:hypothetical protein n=1 Tax=unclassified Micromonospora TaxID=2617518 RepID=UPI00371BFE19